jgi:hypothetical protein
MAIGRHIGERGHVQEKEQNYHTGDTEEREDFINMEEGILFSLKKILFNKFLILITVVL